MAWQKRVDLGTSFIAQVHAALKIDDHWIMDFQRGFRWWASDYAQTIIADVGVFHNLSSVYRIHSEIDLLRGGGKAQQQELYLSNSMSRANLNALCYDPEQDTFRLNCTVYVSEENKDWLAKLFLAAVALQLSTAHHRASQLAADVGGAVATTHHPLHGIRENPHPMVHSLEQFFRPNGTADSRWIGVSEWGEATDMIARLALVCSTDSHSTLHAEFAWGEDPGPAAAGKESVKLTAATDLPHPFLGNGLYLTLRLPIEMGDEQEAHTALALNALERKDWKWWHDFGSWCCLGKDLAFTCFIPNTSYHPSVLPELTRCMALRAQWVNELYMAGNPLLR